MRKLVVVLLIFAALSLAGAVGSPVLANPICENGAASDSDGDGYGWENEDTCIVVDDDSTTADSRSVDSLAAPTNLRLARLASPQLGLVWDPVAGAAGYQVYADGEVVARTSQTSTIVIYNVGTLIVKAHNADRSIWSPPSQSVEAPAGPGDSVSSPVDHTEHQDDDDANSGDVPDPFGHDPLGVFVDGDDTSAPWADNNHQNVRQSGANSLDGWFNPNNLAGVADDANVSDYFESTSQAVQPLAEGSFRIYCSVSHFQQVDPILSKGEPSGHLHMFWGNTETDENSEVGSGGATDLMQNGESTCQGGPYNRSAYWMPALQTSKNGKDHAVLPYNMFMYYKSPVDSRRPDPGGEFIDSNGDRYNIETVNPLPPGIELLGGAIDQPRDHFDKSGSDKKVWPADKEWTGAMVRRSEIGHIDWVNWGCYQPGVGLSQPAGNQPDTIPSSETCRAFGEGFKYVEAQIRFPQCLAVDSIGAPITSANKLDETSSPAKAGFPWDSSDKVSHTYARHSYNAEREYFCPESHPYRIPQITYRVRFKIPNSEKWGQSSYIPRDELANYHLSCDDHVGPDRIDNSANRGWCLHGDWLGGWNEKLVEHWTDGCFGQQAAAGSRQGRNCANGTMNSSIKLTDLRGIRQVPGKQAAYDGDRSGLEWEIEIP